MAVNVFKDTTFEKVHSTEWNSSTAKPSTMGGKEIVLEVDSGTWYVWLYATDTSLNGWYAQ